MEIIKKFNLIPSKRKMYFRLIICSLIFILISIFLLSNLMNPNIIDVGKILIIGLLTTIIFVLCYYIIKFIFQFILKGYNKFINYFFVSDEIVYGKELTKIEKAIETQIDGIIEENKLEFIEKEINRYQIFQKSNNPALASIIISCFSIFSAIVVNILSKASKDTSQQTANSHSMEVYLIMVAIAFFAIGFIIIRAIERDIDFEMRIQTLKREKDKIEKNEKEKIDEDTKKLEEIEKIMEGTKREVETLNRVFSNLQK